MNGWSLERAALMGKPHIRAHYVGEGDRHGLDDDAMCVLCGKPATDAHHVVPKGMGGGSRVYVLETPMGMFPMRSPLFALCRKHHEWFHQGHLNAVWEWDDEEGKEQWEDGTLLSHGYKPHDPRLYGLGRYVIGAYGRTFEWRGDGER